MTAQEIQRRERVETLALQWVEAPDHAFADLCRWLMATAEPGTEPIVASFLREVGASRRAHRTMKQHGWDRYSQK